MAKITDSEREQIPDHNKISEINNEVFEIKEVDKSQQLVWIITKDNRHISIILEHISPDSKLGTTVKKLKSGKFVKLSADRLQKSSKYMPRWYLTEISNIREPKGSEKNVFN